MKRWRIHPDVLFWALFLGGMAIQAWLGLDQDEADPFAWWNWKPPLKPPGGWLDQRQSAIALYVPMVFLIPAIVLSWHALARGRGVTIARAMLRASLLIGVAVMAAGIVALCAQQPRYLWGRWFFTGLLALALAWSALRSATSPPPSASAISS